MRFHHDQGILQLNAEIAARAAIVDQSEHDWVFNVDLGVILCSRCGSWRNTTIGGCRVSAKKAGAK